MRHKSSSSLLKDKLWRQYCQILLHDDNTKANSKQRNPLQGLVWNALRPFVWFDATQRRLKPAQGQGLETLPQHKSRSKAVESCSRIDFGCTIAWCKAYSKVWYNAKAPQACLGTWSGGNLAPRCQHLTSARQVWRQALMSFLVNVKPSMVSAHVQVSSGWIKLILSLPRACQIISIYVKYMLVIC